MHNTFTVPSEKFYSVSFTSAIMKNIVLFAFGSRVRFPVRLIYCIAFGSALTG